MTELPIPECHIAGRRIAADSNPFVIAEVSANHAGSKARALQIIAAAAAAGADAVKFQHYTPETITVRSALPDFRVGGGTLWDGRELADLYAEAMMPWEWTADLVAECRRQGIRWLSTPFDYTAVDFLEPFSPCAYKIASFELVDLPLIRYAASKRRPIIMSTGMATIDEIDAAVAAAYDAGARDIVLLRCNSAYPADPAEMDLNAIPAMSSRWNVPIGLSDHTMSNTTALVAVALGASVIEKHLTMSRLDGGPDSEFSLEPAEFAALTESVAEAFSALGSARFGPSARETPSLKFRRSLRSSRPISAGEELGPHNTRSMRPAGGAPPDSAPRFFGRTAKTDLVAGSPINDEVVD